MTWWLIGNLWWLLPALVALGIGLAFAFGFWPLLVATLGRLPPLAQGLVLAVLVAVIAGSGMYAKGKADGKDSCRRAQAAAEAHADDKAAKVQGRAAEKAAEATETITKETTDATVRTRTIVRTLPATCPDMPAELHDLLQREVEAARPRVPAAAGDAD